MGDKKAIYIISFTNEESLGRLRKTMKAGKQRSQFDGLQPEATKRESLSTFHRLGLYPIKHYEFATIASSWFPLPSH
jgi:hypothetical protein